MLTFAALQVLAHTKPVEITDMLENVRALEEEDIEGSTKTVFTDADKLAGQVLDKFQEHLTELNRQKETLEELRAKTQSDTQAQQVAVAHLEVKKKNAQAAADAAKNALAEARQNARNECYNADGNTWSAIKTSIEGINTEYSNDNLNYA